MLSVSQKGVLFRVTIRVFLLLWWWWVVVSLSSPSPSPFDVVVVEVDFTVCSDLEVVGDSVLDSSEGLALEGMEFAVSYPELASDPL